ncbi:MAG: RhuM family protein [Candidatus Moranbacteria bacterium]|nr:RhuM family protein [Candidatus Moranbacteria bacterium]
MEKPKENNSILLYTTADGQTEIEVNLEDETVWLSQSQMAELFQKDRRTITEHIQNVFREGELVEISVCRKFQHTAADGKSYNINLYNLDVVISVGYRVKSHRGTQFRIWSTQKLREYIVKGFVMDDERLANGNVKKSYFNELLERVRKVRASEKNLYEKVRDIFATSIDYDPKTDFTKEFYATMQNKFHYAITGNTAAELVVNRIDGKKENLGMTAWKGSVPTRKEAEVAKNFMLETELRQLYLLVEQFLSFSEFQIERKRVMYMKDWLEYLHNMIKANKLEVLAGKGKTSHKKMEKKVKEELEKFIGQKKLK